MNSGRAGKRVDQTQGKGQEVRPARLRVVHRRSGIEQVHLREVAGVPDREVDGVVVPMPVQATIWPVYQLDNLAKRR